MKDNIPLGAEYDSSAPWNISSNPEREIEVKVSVTLSRNVKIKVSDYTTEVEKDEDGTHENIDYSTCDLESAVKSQIILPQELHKHVIATSGRGANILHDLKNWVVEDFNLEY